jgi:hypothetical protein
MEFIFFLFSSEMDPEEIEKYFKERYGPKGRAGVDDEDYGDAQMPDEITQQSFLPDVKSPNLWPVKCRIGEEKQTALLLMRKYLALENNEAVKEEFEKEKSFFLLSNRHYKSNQLLLKKVIVVIFILKHLNQIMLKQHVKIFVH